MGSYRDLQDTAARELADLAVSREQRTARLLDDAAAFVAGRWPELDGDPYAVMAVLHCREQGVSATLVPDVRDQLAARAAA
jgi:hypothetical protein